MKQVRNWCLQKEGKSIREGISEGKIKAFIFLFLIYLADNSLRNSCNDIRGGREELRVLCYCKVSVLPMERYGVI